MPQSKFMQVGASERMVKASFLSRVHQNCMCKTFGEQKRQMRCQFAATPALYWWHYAHGMSTQTTFAQTTGKKGKNSRIR
jgi:hypothetical protein